MKFRDFRVGQALEGGTFRVDEASMVAFARDYDPQWFHADRGRAAAGPYGELIASGWQTCGIAMRLITEAFLHDSESFGSPGVAYVKWPNPVRAGDVLRLRADVIETRTSRQRPTLGILRWRWRLSNQRAEEVLDLEVTSLFDLA